MEDTGRTDPHALPSLALTVLRRRIESQLSDWDHGQLELELPNRETIVHKGAGAGPRAVIKLNKWWMLSRLLFEGEVGLGRGYVEGEWSTPDLPAVLAYGLANQAALLGRSGGWRMAHLFNRFGHRRNANTKRGSRRNIAAHYDLGNAFYAHWLDDEMLYSSAIFENGADSLEIAQRRKLDRVVDLMSLKPGHSVLEIGCGWGALIGRMVDAGASSVTGISLSREQIGYARQRFVESQIDERAQIAHQDYRDVTARFDRIVSIEMFEAVGEKYWPVFFEQIARCLNRNGAAVLQIITIAEDLFESYKQRPDFIQQYIFPGGMLPTVSRVRAEAEKAGLAVVHYEPFRLSYARTLDEWHHRFEKAWPEIEKLGFDLRFRRMWDYYLAYCAAGFRHGSIDVGLFRLEPMRAT